ncbi:MAG: hypothetical protein RR140_00190 [Clostridia bacterium]
MKYFKPVIIIFALLTICLNFNLQKVFCLENQNNQTKIVATFEQNVVASGSKIVFSKTLGEITTIATLTLKLNNYLNESIVADVTWFYRKTISTSFESKIVKSNIVFNFEPTYGIGEYEFVATYQNNETTVYSNSFLIEFVTSSASIVPEGNNLKIEGPHHVQNVSNTSNSKLPVLYFEAKGVPKEFLNGVVWFVKVDGGEEKKQGNGGEFFFNPIETGVYFVRASINIGGSEQSTLTSNNIRVNVTVDNTKYIIIGSSVVFVVLLLSLIISIVMSIKKEKIW